MAMTVINPATGERAGSYEELLPEQVDEAIRHAHEAQLSWRCENFSTRARLMKRAADILRERRGKLAELMAMEMGKPLREGNAEIDKCAWVCEYYAEHAERHLEDEIILSDFSKSYITYQALGVVLAVMPWNFPFWQVFRFAAPSLMAGNAGLLKHASNVPGCALAIEEVFEQAGFPFGLFQTLLISSAQVGRIIENPRVMAVTLTGSTPAGQAVARSAGEVLKKVVLELGGSDPYLILDDADLELAVDACVTSRLLNAGQSCIAAKRFIVDETLRSSFERKMVEKMAGFEPANPLAEGTLLGPMARQDLRDEVHHQVLASIDKGAQLLLGGKVPAGPGAYYPPTVLTGVQEGMPAYDEEIFGPVAAIISARGEKDAIRIANDTVFGLGAAVFTKDLARGERIAARDLAAGSCFVNDFVRSDPRLPFGGIKESGYGRELHREGIREFVNIKTVALR